MKMWMFTILTPDDCTILTKVIARLIIVFLWYYITATFFKCKNLKGTFNQQFSSQKYSISLVVAYSRQHFNCVRNDPSFWKIGRKRKFVEIDLLAATIKSWKLTVVPRHFQRPDGKRGQKVLTRPQRKNGTTSHTHLSREATNLELHCYNFCDCKTTKTDSPKPTNYLLFHANLCYYTHRKKGFN